MALAWNAGWVNSPRGFKSRILRTRSEGRPVGSHELVAPWPRKSEEEYEPQSCGVLARVVFDRRRRLVLLFRPAALARADRRHRPRAGHGHADRRRRADRPGRVAGGVHAAAHP